MGTDGPRSRDSKPWTQRLESGPLSTPGSHGSACIGTENTAS